MMRKLIFTATAILLTLTLNAQDSTVFMSYNIRAGLGLDGKRMYDRPAAVIAGAHPDAVAVQEVDLGVERSDKADVLGEIARLTGLKPTFAPAIEYGGGQYGVGILSAEEPIRTSIVPLPGREERRVLLMAEFGKYFFCCTHLSLTPEDGLASVEIIDGAITEFSKDADKPVFLAGDWNAEPSSETIAAFRKRFDILNDTSVCTFPADKPEITIDYIAVWRGNDAGLGLQPSQSSVPEASSASDHRPVVVEL